MLLRTGIDIFGNGLGLLHNEISASFSRLVEIHVKRWLFHTAVEIIDHLLGLAEVNAKLRRGLLDVRADLDYVL